ncbi:uncharacterized protein LOC123662347 [Melitaea cinxia]|uniref:uncharacterized protein LOC123662347 n=1 Tax=Melitaea cinxia TaxID=113334 RepID=UPI001E274C34|nr:uncharacterized protein LOC123662347 [Melitaea cinxia]
MSETRKNHLTIDGGQVKEATDEHVASYKPIPESDTDFRTSKTSIHKSKEKLSADGAEEKLLQKEDEAKIITRVDMADVKYVVGDHRNGDAKIELDANKKQFSGLTKEELMKYAEDPFWVRLRWFMFVLFWALWLCMLAGAIAIIVRAPKCAPPTPRTWYEKGPLVDMSTIEDYSEIEASLPLLEKAKVSGIFAFTCKDTYEVLEDSSCIDRFKEFVVKAKNVGVRVIVDLTAGFVSKTHKWFQMSENRSSEYSDYFVWAKGNEYDPEKLSTQPKPPNRWVSTLDEPAWSWSEKRQEYYLHMYAEDQPDLNFANVEVVRKFDAVIKLWMEAGASGIRLHKARELHANEWLAEERPAGAGARGADHTQRDFWRNQHSADAPAVDALLAHWGALVGPAGEHDTVFTIAETGPHVELFLLERNTSALRPPSAAPVKFKDSYSAYNQLIKFMARRPALQLSTQDGADEELAMFSMVLPSTPVLSLEQIGYNNTLASEALLHAVALREDASIQHGEFALAIAPVRNSSKTVFACARWKRGHTGYVGLYNSRTEDVRADLRAVRSLPAALAAYLGPRANGTRHIKEGLVNSDDVFVPARSTVILSYVPNTAAED